LFLLVFSSREIAISAKLYNEEVPPFEFLRLLHKPIQFYDAKAALDSTSTHFTYELSYPELNRKISINFEKKTPFSILGWNEFDLSDPKKTTTATRKKIMKLPYWQLNNLGDERFRDSLKLR